MQKKKTSPITIGLPAGSQFSEVDKLQNVQTAALTTRIQELELQGKEREYILNNQLQDTNRKLDFALQKVSAIEVGSGWREVFELYNKESKQIQKELRKQREEYINMITSHEKSYAVLSGLGIKSRDKQEKTITSELLIVKKQNKKFELEIKQKEEELYALKNKERGWVIDKKEVEQLRINYNKMEKEHKNLGNIGPVIPRNIDIKQDKKNIYIEQDRAINNLAMQNESLETKIKESEVLIVNLLNQIDFLKSEIQKNKGSKQPISTRKDMGGKPRNIPNNVAGSKSPRGELGIPNPNTISLPESFLIDKGDLIRKHSNIKQTKHLLMESIKQLRQGIKTNKLNDGKLESCVDIILSSTDMLFGFVHELEMKELNYLNTLAEISSSPHPETQNTSLAPNTKGPSIIPSPQGGGPGW